MMKKILSILLTVLVMCMALFMVTACKNGADGKDGVDGITPTIEISNDGYWVINGEKTSVKASVDNLEDSEYSQGLEFTVSSDRSGYVVSGVGTCIDKVVKIPNSYKGKPVVGIGAGAFCQNTFYDSDFKVKLVGDEYIEEVIIPDSVTYIGACAFYKSINLKKVTIGNGVVSLGDSAFEYCSNLISVTLGNNVADIGDYAFSYCVKLFEVINKSPFITIEKGDYSNNGGIGGYAFDVFNSNDTYVNKISIDDNGFVTCNVDNSITLISYFGESENVIVPSNVTSIYNCAFIYNNNIKTITIGENVNEIGVTIIEGCKNITDIIFLDQSTWYADPNIFEGFEDLSECYLLDVSNSEDNVDKLSVYQTDIGGFAACFWRKF